MITLDEYFSGRDIKYPPTDEMICAAENLLSSIEQLEADLNEIFILSSGYRPEEMIEDHELPGCPHDAHSRCQGIDLHDPELLLTKYLMSNQQLLTKNGLWLESSISAKNHCHLQSYSPESGRRVFIA